MNTHQRNIAASIKQKLINLSKERKEDSNYVFMRFALERFLYRLSCSPYSHKFILKGAMLWAVWANKPHRPTKDLDLLGRGNPSATVLQKIIREICNINVEQDGIIFNPDSIAITEIREDVEYSGQRVKLESKLGNAQINIQIDIAYGDSIVPNPVDIEYPTLLDLASPYIKAYPIETFVAEKLETMVSKGIINSRMRDFYDLNVLAMEFGFKGDILTKSIRATFNRRGTTLPNDCPIAFTQEFCGNTEKQVQWQAFLRMSKLDQSKIELPAVVNLLKEFLLPPLYSAANNVSFSLKWRPGSPWK